MQMTEKGVQDYRRAKALLSEGMSVEVVAAELGCDNTDALEVLLVMGAMSLSTDVSQDAPPDDRP